VKPEPSREPVGERALLEVAGVRKSFGTHVVLDGIDLDLPAGSAVAITGRNGVGKTTLLRVAGGLILPDEGSVWLDGASPRFSRRDFHRRLGYLSAGDRGLYARLSVRRHLDLWGKLALLPPGARAEAVARSLERFELTDLAEQRVDRVSMGQRQRVRLAMAFLHEPDVVLLDEPLTSLDPPSAVCVGAAILELRDRGGSALWCAPALDGVAIDFDQVTEIIEGRLVVQ
jgi:ABC-type multidrug transport system ATPase subunit